MKPNFSLVVWGLALILTGGFALANEMDYWRGFTAQTWGLVFATASALFFVAYFINGIRAWGWLFPACMFAGLSAAVFVSEISTVQRWIPTLVVGSVAAPFVAAFALDRSRKWALIPAFILTFVAFIPPLDNLLKGEWMGALIIGMVGLPFIAASLISDKAWWGLIPGGILLSIALLLGLEKLLPDGMAVSIMFLGWMLTFGLIWMRQSRSWAKSPTIAMGTLSGTMLLISLDLQTYWSLGLIIVGIVLVAISLRRHKAAVE